MYTCFLFGHSDAPDSLRESLENVITYHVEKLFVSKFIVGHYGNFDRMAIAALRKAKLKYPQISCYLLIPYFFGAAEVQEPCASYRQPDFLLLG